jgi:acetolactate synthase-1/2/3 large subunit
MGFGLGAAIGAKVANPGRPVVLFTGDGSFHMNLNELACAVSENLNIVIVIMNNGVLGMVRQWQRLLLQGEVLGLLHRAKTRFREAGRGLRGPRLQTSPKRCRLGPSSQRGPLFAGPCILDCPVSEGQRVFPLSRPNGTSDDTHLL